MRFPIFSLALLLLLAPAPATAKAPAAPATATATKATPVVPDAPKTVEDAAESVSFLVAAAKGGHWSLFLGVLLTLLVWVLDKFVKLKDRVGSKALPWVAAGLGILATMGISLSSGLSLGEGLIQGFMTGATSVGLWELVFKHALKKKDEPAVV